MSRTLVVGSLLLAAPRASLAAAADEYVGSWAPDPESCGTPAVIAALFTSDLPEAQGKTLIEVTTTVDGQPARHVFVFYDDASLRMDLEREDGTTAFVFFEPRNGDMMLMFTNPNGATKGVVGGVELKAARQKKLVRCSLAASPATVSQPPPVLLASKTSTALQEALGAYQRSFGPSWLVGSFGQVNYGDYVAFDEQGTPAMSSFEMGCWTQASSYRITHPTGQGIEHLTPRLWVAPDGTEVLLQGRLTFFVGKDGNRYTVETEFNPYILEVIAGPDSTQVHQVTVDAKKETLIVRVDGQPRWTVSLKTVLEGHPADVRTPWLDGYDRLLWVDSIWQDIPGAVDASYFLLEFVEPDGRSLYLSSCQTVPP